MSQKPDDGSTRGVPRKNDVIATLRLANGELIEIPFNWLNGYFPEGTFKKRRRRVKKLEIEEIIPYGEKPSAVRLYQPVELS